MQVAYTLLDVPEKKSRLSLEEEVSLKMEQDERWRLIPYDYAYLCIAHLFTFEDALEGIRKHLTPDELFFQREGYTPDKIKEWSDL